MMSVMCLSIIEQQVVSQGDTLLMYAGSSLTAVKEVVNQRQGAIKLTAGGPGVIIMARIPRMQRHYSADTVQVGRFIVMHLI